MEHLSDAFTWAKGHVEQIFEWTAVWIVCLVVTLWAARYFLISLPVDYLSTPHKPLEFWKDSHPVLRWTVLIVKNLVGLIFMIAGLVMIVTPGPGWIVLLLGLYLVDIPGKRTVERKILRQHTILSVVNRVRTAAHRPPLEVPPHGADA